MNCENRLSDSALRYFVYSIMVFPPNQAWVVLCAFYALPNALAEDKGALSALYVEKIIKKNQRSKEVCCAICNCLEVRASKEVTDAAIRAAAGVRDLNLVRAWRNWRNARPNV